MATRNNNNNEEKPAGNSAPTSTLPGFLASSLNIPTSYPLGADRVDTNSTVFEQELIQSNVHKPVPGILVIDYIPTLGKSDSPSSAVNRAAFYEFNKIRSQISGNRPYEPADHMIYRAAVDSLYDLYDWLVRVYKIISGYSAANLYRPKDVLTALGLNAEDTIHRANELYYWLLTHRAAMEPFPTVNMGNISQRRALFNSAIFKDGDIESTQMYIMNQRAFWSYEAVDQVKGLTLKDTIGYTSLTGYMDLWENMYEALQNSSDVYIIAADIRRAFGDSVRALPVEVAVTEQIEYTKMDEMLTSIMNVAMIDASMYTNAPSNEGQILTDIFRIRDDGGVIKCGSDYHAPLCPGRAAFKPFTFVSDHINLIEAAPSKETVLRATRLKPAVTVTYTDTNNSTGHTYLKFDAFGTEVVVSMWMFVHGENRRVRIHTGMSDCVNDVDPSSLDAEVMCDIMALVSSLANFDWHPPLAVAQLYCGEVDGGTYVMTPEHFYIVEDVQNYVPITHQNLRQIHEATLLAQFGIE